MHLRGNSGMTLLELLMVVALMALVTTFVVLAFLRTKSHQILEENALIVESALNEARSLSVDGAQASEYGVHFEAGFVSLFRGANYVSSDVSNVVTNLDNIVGIRNINLNDAGQNVVFKRLSGKTNQYGTVEVYLKKDVEEFRTVTVTKEGLVENK